MDPSLFCSCPYLKSHFQHTLTISVQPQSSACFSLWFYSELYLVTSHPKYFLSCGPRSSISFRVPPHSHSSGSAPSHGALCPPSLHTYSWLIYKVQLLSMDRASAREPPPQKGRAHLHPCRTEAAEYLCSSEPAPRWGESAGSWT